MTLKEIQELFQLNCFKVSPNDQEEEKIDHKEQCKELNQQRANFTACCLFPTLVFWRWQINQCKAQCKDAPEDEFHCCCVLCDKKLIGLVADDDEASDRYLHNPVDGIIYSFMLSIGNDSAWKPVVETAAKHCNDVVEKKAEYTNCNIPKHLYRIIDCVYSENYFNCPENVWNPDGLNLECQHAKDYIDQCFRIKENQQK